MKINESYYVVLNKENKYYDQEDEWWYADIRDATRYDNWEQANGMSEYLNMYIKHTRTAFVEVKMEITIQDDKQ